MLCILSYFCAGDLSSTAGHSQMVYANIDSANLVAFPYYHSAPACCANEVEVYELHGRVYIAYSYAVEEYNV